MFIVGYDIEFISGIFFQKVTKSPLNESIHFQNATLKTFQNIC